MAATRLILIRHGHTAGNSSGGLRMSGWTDTSLSDRGRLQVACLARRISSEPVSVVYASPLLRAQQTARPVATAAGAELRLEPDLREIHCGEVDGWPVAEVQRLHPGLWKANLRQDDEGFRWPGGESYRELRERSLEAVRRIAAAHPGERIAVVTHAGVISQIVGCLRGNGAACWERYRPENCSLTELDWEGETGQVVSYDDRGHLEGGFEEPGPPASTHPRGG
ncbi:MAG TPA: histidine phosphatase family protein [Thermoanaerobaculia bacterium]|nr:histidine phosphatase family protein [Thermoanaerobaculia bacterium]